MSFLLENWLLVLLAVTSGAMLAWQHFGARGGGELPPAEVVRRINREKGLLIDVATHDEYLAGHAAGARNAPIDQLVGAPLLPANKQLPVILTCASGVRAQKAAGMLRKAGYPNAVAMAGGNKAWRDAGLPMERGPSAAAKAAARA